VFAPEMEASDAVAAQLRARGIEPSEIKTVIMTHLHGDHASGISEFPGATFLVSQQEWDEASTVSRPAMHGYVRRHFDHAFDFRTIDFGGDAVDSFATFGRAVDVLGDGSIWLAFTPGHTLGHMSVILRLKGREVLVAADAIYTRHALESGHKPYLMEDEHLYARSVREIQIYAEQTPDALIIPGHDMEAWRELEPVYE
jgi:glyoxylase-like metal-dependent hydrolase (beta-lactamase superfamily II)